MLLKICHRTFPHIYHLLYLKFGKTEIISFYLFEDEEVTYSRIQLFDKLVTNVRFR